MPVKLASKLPDGDTNGLGRITAELCDTPDEVHVAIVLLDCSQITTDTDSGDVVPTARVRAIEPVGDTTDAKMLRRLARRAYERRTGRTELPLEVETEISKLYPDGDIDDEDGEQ